MDYERYSKPEARLPHACPPFRPASLKRAPTSSTSSSRASNDVTLHDATTSRRSLTVSTATLCEPMSCLWWVVCAYVRVWTGESDGGEDDKKMARGVRSQSVCLTRLPQTQAQQQSAVFMMAMPSPLTSAAAVGAGCRGASARASQAGSQRAPEASEGPSERLTVSQSRLSAPLRRVAIERTICCSACVCCCWTRK